MGFTSLSEDYNPDRKEFPEGKYLKTFTDEYKWVNFALVCLLTLLSVAYIILRNRRVKSNMRLNEQLGNQSTLAPHCAY